MNRDIQNDCLIWQMGQFSLKNSGTLYNAVKLWDNCDYRQPRIILSDWQVLQTQRKKKTMKPETKTL